MRWTVAQVKACTWATCRWYSCTGGCITGAAASHVVAQISTNTATARRLRCRALLEFLISQTLRAGDLESYRICARPTMWTTGTQVKTRSGAAGRLSAIARSCCTWATVVQIGINIGTWPRATVRHGCVALENISFISKIRIWDP